MSTHIVVVGDAFLDVDIEGRATRLCPDGPVPVVEESRSVSRPGGAGLAASIAAHHGCRTTLLYARADDDAGRALEAALAAHGVSTVGIGPARGTSEKIRVRAGGQTLLRIDRDRDRSRIDDTPLADGAASVLTSADAVLVSDYGRGVTDHPHVRQLVARVASRRPVVWDPHPRGAAPVAGCWAVTPNRSEAFTLVGLTPSRSLRDTRRCAAELQAHWHSRAVVVTLDRDGALLETGLGPPLAVPVGRPEAGDACGAGDAFAVALTRAFAAHHVTSEAVVAAVEAAARFVGGGGVAALRVEGRQFSLSETPSPAESSAADLAPDATGRVVAAGGCFDVLHIGHVQLLEHARRLGDRLVVLLNSDESVRALKGPPRPIVPAQERAGVLRALGCVDEVRIFEERTTDVALRRVRPDVFVKGGDYGHGPIAEQAILDEWGGQAVVVPYVAGRSTTHLLQEARHHDRDPTG